jgi:hypothetical protein
MLCNFLHFEEFVEQFTGQNGSRNCTLPFLDSAVFYLKGLFSK